MHMDPAIREKGLPSHRARIMVVFGTRPEAIKLGPVIKALQDCPDFDIHVCVTGQHRSMLDQVMDVFGIEPDHDLDLMQPGQHLGEINARILSGVTATIRDVRPDWIIVQGDTATAFAASLAAFYENVPVGHVEAGLRTWDMRSPFPEEMNRRLISCVARLHFAPTLMAKQNLECERLPHGGICVTGNTVVDALLWVGQRLGRDPQMKARMDRTFGFLTPGRKLVLVTGHRRENFGEPFRDMCHALLDIAASAEVDIVYPAHLNPNVQAPVTDILRQAPPELAGRIHIIEPLDYPSFVHALERAALVITDSGGVQEEAPTFGKPVLVTRDTTERPEAVQAGLARLVGTSRQRIAAEAIMALRGGGDWPTARANPFGDGRASARIVERLREAIGLGAAVLPEFAEAPTEEPMVA